MSAGARVCLVLVVLCLAPAPRAPGDAIPVTRAMTANTIAEIFVEPEAIRVELEIGLASLGAFRNVMPDELYERMGNPPVPLAERVERFFRQDLVIRADDAGPLTGELLRVEPRSRVKRDEITGEPLPVQDGDAELVVAAELVYPLDEPPAVLSFAPPFRADGRFAAAGIGFVVYHRGLAVNDFRYLAAQEVLDLDWADPWYSHFRNRDLARRFAAPIMGFLYVDAFEVRQEIIARPKDLQQWVDLGLDGVEVIPVRRQAEIKAKVAAFLAGRNPVRVDGELREPVLDRINFVRRTLRTTGVVDPPEDLPVVSATLGAIFVYPVTGLPQEVTMEWQLFGDRFPAVPTVATDEAGGLPFTVTADDPVLRWENFLVNPKSTALVDLAPPPEPRRVDVPVATVICALLAVVLAFFPVRPRMRIGAVVVLVIAGAVLMPYGRLAVRSPGAGDASVTAGDAREIVAALLRNVYRAFDYRSEDVIYNALERSAAGDLLTDIYLETRASLELENQGGARARVTDVEVLNAETTNLPDEVGFETRCTWIVAGSVGHWGHIHQRRNQYEAVLTVKPVDGAWKVTALDLLTERRL
jgi:hypothetical protein